MANALKGKTITTTTAILPNEEVAAKFLEPEALDNHFEFMQTKSYKSGPLKLIQYYVSSGPEWNESASFLGGKMPEKTGRVIVSAVEIYETEDGLHHHWIESKEHHQVFLAWLKEVDGEIQTYSFHKILQSLWD